MSIVIRQNDVCGCCSGSSCAILKLLCCMLMCTDGQVIRTGPQTKELSNCGEGKRLCLVGDDVAFVKCPSIPLNQYCKSSASDFIILSLVPVKQEVTFIFYTNQISGHAMYSSFYFLLTKLFCFLHLPAAGWSFLPASQLGESLLNDCCWTK